MPSNRTQDTSTTPYLLMVPVHFYFSIIAALLILLRTSRHALAMGSHDPQKLPHAISMSTLYFPKLSSIKNLQLVIALAQSAHSFENISRGSSAHTSIQLWPRKARRLWRSSLNPPPMGMLSSISLASCVTAFSTLIHQCLGNMHEQQTLACAVLCLF